MPEAPRREPHLGNPLQATASRTLAQLGFESALALAFLIIEVLSRFVPPFQPSLSHVVELSPLYIETALPRFRGVRLESTFLQVPLFLSEIDTFLPW